MRSIQLGNAQSLAVNDRWIGVTLSSFWQVTRPLRLRRGFLYAVKFVAASNSYEQVSCELGINQAAGNNVLLNAKPLGMTNTGYSPGGVSKLFFPGCGDLPFDTPVLPAGAIMDAVMGFYFLTPAAAGFVDSVAWRLTLYYEYTEDDTAGGRKEYIPVKKESIPRIKLFKGLKIK